VSKFNELECRISNLDERLFCDMYKRGPILMSPEKQCTNCNWWNCIRSKH
jgi:hypothetical protein